MWWCVLAQQVQQYIDRRLNIRCQITGLELSGLCRCCTACCADVCVCGWVCLCLFFLQGAFVWSLSLPLPHTYTHTHARTHAHTHTHILDAVAAQMAFMRWMSSPLAASLSCHALTATCLACCRLRLEGIATAVTTHAFRVLRCSLIVTRQRQTGQCLVCTIAHRYLLLLLMAASFHLMLAFHDCCSTGRPKGVVGRHSSLTHFYDFMGTEFSLSSEDRCVGVGAWVSVGGCACSNMMAT